MGYEEISHTADWSLRAWADDFERLLAESARGMYWLAGVELAEGPREKREFEVEGPDEEDFLVSFLTELVYYTEQEKVGFDDFDIQTKNGRLKVEVQGAPLKSLTKEIKAVTYHNLKIERTSRGVEAEIVFDV